MKPNKTCKRLVMGLALIALPWTALAANQIQVSATFIEGSGENQDILSSPSVLMLEEQEARIEVIQEHVVAAPFTKKTQNLPVISEGITMVVEGKLQDGKVLLKGTLRISQVNPKAAGNRANAAWASTNVSESEFVLLVKPGERVPIVLPSLEKPKEQVRVEITVNVIAETNAAPIYWRAFAALPEKPNMDDETAVKEWVAASGKALDLLLEAASHPHCDWELDLSQGPGLTLPHISKMMSLTQAAVARAGMTLSDDPASSHRDLQAAMQAGSHTGSDPLLICQLVRVAIQNRVVQALEPVDLSAEAKASWKAWVAADSGYPTLQRLIEVEGEINVAFLRALLEKEGGEAVKKALGAELESLRGGEKVIRKFVDTLEADYAEMVRIAGLPYAESKAAFEAFIERTVEKKKTEHLLTALMAPALESIADKLHGAEVQLEAFRKKLD